MCMHTLPLDKQIMHAANYSSKAQLSVIIIDYSFNIVHTYHIVSSFFKCAVHLLAITFTVLKTVTTCQPSE